MTCEKIGNEIRAHQQLSAPFIDKQLLSVPRLAEYLDVPVATVRDWIYKRQIPFVKAGRHVRFVPSDVLGWLSDRRKTDGDL